MARFTLYVTPDDTSPSIEGFVVSLPDDEFLISAFLGAFSTLTKPENWQEVGDMTPDECAELFQQCWDAMLPLAGCP